ncbi:hypothetical protein DFJ74DRAFT_262116 [Hyaloraphidium curvatum]|nr:hypothetical protein DFJ74DRAFT_262116 [Hyaloraphidium curvatum]
MAAELPSGGLARRAEPAVPLDNKKPPPPSLGEFPSDRSQSQPEGRSYPWWLKNNSVSKLRIELRTLSDFTSCEGYVMTNYTIRTCRCRLKLRRTLRPLAILAPGPRRGPTAHPHPLPSAARITLTAGPRAEHPWQFMDQLLSDILSDRLGIRAAKAGRPRQDRDSLGNGLGITFRNPVIPTGYHGICALDLVLSSAFPRVGGLLRRSANPARHGNAPLRLRPHASMAPLPP